MGWGNETANTNVAYLRESILGQYVSGSVAIFRCPGDTVPSDNGLRVRSYSMNGQIGVNTLTAIAAANRDNPNHKAFKKVSDVGSCPGPSDTFVFCEESMFTMNDGYLQISMTTATFPDMPGAYHKWNAGFSFVDGHAELRRWETPVLKKAVVAKGTPPSTLAGPNNPDWRWFTSKASCPK